MEGQEGCSDSRQQKSFKKKNKGNKNHSTHKRNDHGGFIIHAQLPETGDTNKQC